MQITSYVAALIYLINSFILYGSNTGFSTNFFFFPNMAHALESKCCVWIPKMETLEIIQFIWSLETSERKTYFDSRPN